MSLRGVLTALISAMLISAVAIFNVKVALYIIAAFYMIKGILQVANKEYYKSIEKFMNIDRYNAYQKKSDEFKKYIKSDPISDFLMGGLFIYFSMRFNANINNIKVALMVFVFVILDYFVEAYAMSKKDKWEDYKKTSILTAMVLIFLVFILFI